MSKGYSLGQFDDRTYRIALGAADAAISKYRQQNGIYGTLPFIEVGPKRGRFTTIGVRAEQGGAAPSAPFVWGLIGEAINAALQQNRSTMTTIDKPMPKTLGAIELEIADLEGRLRKRKAKSRDLDQRVQRLRARARQLRYPTEPTSLTPAITFRKRYEGPGSKVYLYAAIKVNGRWYTTGSTCPAQGFTWVGLIDFIRQDNQLVGEGFNLFERLYDNPTPF